MVEYDILVDDANPAPNNDNITIENIGDMRAVIHWQILFILDPWKQTPSSKAF